MSLLLEALKRAEKAKEEAHRRTHGEEPGARPLELAPDPEPAPAPAESKPVLTRSELPDISQPLEILTEDIAPPRPKAPPRAAPPRASVAEEAPPAAQERAAAKAVFQVKHREPNPRLPFHITMGLLAAFAVGTVVYFWYQLRPPAPLVNANPPRQQASAAIAQAPEPVAAPAAQPSAPAASATAIPGLPGTAAPSPKTIAAAPSPSAPAPSASAPAPSVAASTPAPAAKARVRPRAEPAIRRTTPAAAAPAAQADAEPEIRIARPPAQVHPMVDTAYAAYQAGNLGAARDAYEAALREEPGNRDALLGMAAVELRSARPQAAQELYQRLLRADPRDPHALAGMLALRSGGADPLATESRVKNLLATEPQAHVLNFALGNQLAQQGRWPEAQQQYFKAFSADSANADYAYNLAVSLDHLRQPQLARQYYERALALSQTRTASFDRALARQRVEQLARP